MSPRIGVLYIDGSIVLVSPTASGDPEAEARDMIQEANYAERDPLRMAKLVSVDLEPTDIVVLESTDTGAKLPRDL